MDEKTTPPPFCYDHSRYAGNFGDVLKHLVLVRVLRQLLKDDRSLLYIDTHAGAGVYALKAHSALPDHSYRDGIGKLWMRDEVPIALRDYLDLVHRFNPPGTLERYPGSPWIASQLLRGVDRLCLFDRQDDVVAQLQSLFTGQTNIKTSKDDGYTACIALLAPRAERCLVLIDPPYKRTSDYREVMETLSEAQRRCPEGVYALWYPVVDRRCIDALENAICASAMPDPLLLELNICDDSNGDNMTGCGMLVINSPPGLSNALDEVLPYLADALGNAGSGSFRIDRLASG